jgi:hypothetical protein
MREREGRNVDALRMGGTEDWKGRKRWRRWGEGREIREGEGRGALC